MIRCCYSDTMTRLTLTRLLCTISEKSVLPPEPTNCCMSGCANCVWIEYAQEVSKIIGDSGQVAKAKIIENVQDPNLRAFLLLELNSSPKKVEK